MPTLSTDQSHAIEITALKGKAIASLLGVASGTGDINSEDLVLTAYAIEEHFRAILGALEVTQSLNKEK